MNKFIISTLLLLASSAFAQFGGGDADGFDMKSYSINMKELNAAYIGGTGGGSYTASLNAVPLAVELISFKANVTKQGIVLNWKTANEVNNYGFEIERRLKESTNSMWITVGFVKGNGNSNSIKEYHFPDQKIPTGVYLYRLKQIDSDGTFTYSDIVEVVVNHTPENFVLDQNYPNPFNPVTRISFSIPTMCEVSIKIFNSLGKEIATLIKEIKAPGFYSVDFNASGLSSGIYFYKMNAGDFRSIKKMMLLK